MSGQKLHNVIDDRCTALDCEHEAGPWCSSCCLLQLKYLGRGENSEASAEDPLASFQRNVRDLPSQNALQYWLEGCFPFRLVPHELDSMLQANPTSVTRQLVPPGSKTRNSGNASSSNCPLAMEHACMPLMFGQVAWCKVHI